jgi:ABC-2 type transport system ATP-binding protein
MIRVENLTRYFQGKTALKNLNFEIRRGDSVGIIGPNGSGKTTFISILLGLLKPSSGSIQIEGLDSWEEKHKILPRVGAVIEIPKLYPSLSHIENLAIFSEYQGIPNPKTRISEVLKLVRLDSVSAKLQFRNYSLGMKQRLGIALSLLNDPEILVFDEPTNGLDPEGIIQIREILKELRSLGKTIILCSHLIQEVEQICKTALILRNGEIRKIVVIDSQNQDKISFRIRTLPSAWSKLLDFIPTRKGWSSGSQDQNMNLLELDVVSDIPGRKPVIENSDTRQNDPNSDREILSLSNHSNEGETNLLAAGILKELIQAGIEVIEFAPTMESLEAKFMEAVQ